MANTQYVPVRPYAPGDQRPSQRDGTEVQHPDLRVLSDPGWLPDGEPVEGMEIDGLDELRDKHHELLDARRVARDAVRALRAQYAAEDGEITTHWESGASGRPPRGTDAAVRTATLSAAMEAVHAADTDLVNFRLDVVEAMQAREPIIRAHLEGHANHVAAERARLEAELNALGRDGLRVERLEAWMMRTTRGVPGTLLAWETLRDMLMSTDGATGGHSRAAKPLPPRASDAVAQPPEEAE